MPAMVFSPLSTITENHTSAGCLVIVILISGKWYLCYGKDPIDQVTCGQGTISKTTVSHTVFLRQVGECDMNPSCWIQRPGSMVENVDEIRWVRKLSHVIPFGIFSRLFCGSGRCMVIVSLINGKWYSCYGSDPIDQVMRGKGTILKVVVSTLR